MKKIIWSIMTPQLGKSGMRKKPFHTHLKKLDLWILTKPMVSNQKNCLKTFEH